jgi:hypothetical protein
LPQLNVLFPIYWNPTRDLYIVIHLSLLYPCAKSRIVQSSTFTLQSSISFLQFQMIQSHSICVQYIINGPMLLACDSMRMSVEQGL